MREKEDPQIKYFQYILNVIAFISSKWASWVSNVRIRIHTHTHTRNKQVMNLKSEKIIIPGISLKDVFERSCKVHSGVILRRTKF